MNLTNSNTVITEIENSLDYFREKYAVGWRMYTETPNDVIVFSFSAFSAVVNVRVDEANIVREPDPVGYLRVVVLEPEIQRFIISLGESVTGKYPFTRLWADRHLTGLPILYGNPEHDVPGWVHNKFRHQDKYPKEGTVVVNQPTLGPKITYPENLGEIPVASNTKAKKKVVVQKKRSIDPRRVKKPKCVKHETDMEFDAVSGKWRCTIEGCPMVARPKRADDDKTVTLGKGSIQLRLIVQNDDINVVLISDDNIALDITTMVNVNEIIDTFDAVQEARVASENGKNFFTIEIDKAIGLMSRLTVMGADDLALKGDRF